MEKKYNNLKYKKILVLQNSGVIGGAEKNLERWIDYFYEKYNISVYMCGPGKGTFFDEMASKGIRIIRTNLPEWRKGKNFIYRYLVRSRITTTLLREEPFDLIFSNDFFYAPYAVYFGKKLNIPVVVHIQSDCEPKRIHQYSLDRVEGVIITTKSSYKKINPYFKPDVLTRIPYGVEIPPKISTFDRQFRKNPKNFVFGVAANLLPHKGIDFVFKLASSLIATQGWEIHWVGGDPQGLGEKFNSKVKQLGLEDRLFYHGFYKDMDIYYKSIDCLIHPAQYEPFGIVLIEAMSHGLPVISTCTKGGFEVIGDIDEGNWIVGLDGWAQMAELMKEVMNSRENIRRFGQKFEEKYQKEFLFSQSMEKLEILFSNIFLRNSKALGQKCFSFLDQGQ